MAAHLHACYGSDVCLRCIQQLPCSSKQEEHFSTGSQAWPMLLDPVLIRVENCKRCDH